MSFQESLEGDCGRDRVRRCCLLTSFQEGLEGDRGRDRVQWCCLLTLFQENPYQKLFFQKKNLQVRWQTVDIVKNLMLLLAHS